MEEALRFHPHPEFQLVGRNHHKISGHVLGCERIHTGTAVARINAIEFVFDQDVALVGNQLVKLRLEFLVTRRLVFQFLRVVDFATPPGLAHFAIFFAHLIAQFFLGIDDFEIFFVILCPNGRRSFEHHVLE